MTEPPTCPYCGQDAALVSGDVVYPNRADLGDKRFWRCADCSAWVGCHPGTDRPLGRLADADLRAAKQRAHASFDPLWQTKMRRERTGKGEARGAGYIWLANQLGIAFAECHIGMFDVATCDRVVAICKPFHRGLRSSR